MSNNQKGGGKDKKVEEKKATAPKPAANKEPVKTEKKPAAAAAPVQAHTKKEEPKKESRGFGYYFNNHTIRGRANVSKVTLASLFTYYIYRKFVKSPEEEKKEPQTEMNYKFAGSR